LNKMNIELIIKILMQIFKADKIDGFSSLL